MRKKNASEEARGFPERVADAICHRPEQEKSPRNEGDEDDGDVKPEGLDVLEFGSEEALEIVFDDEDAKEIGIAAGAENVPGKSGEAEAGDGDGMKTAEGVAPAFGEDGPEQNSAAGENDRGRTFCENGEAEEEAEEAGSEGG